MKEEEVKEKVSNFIKSLTKEEVTLISSKGYFESEVKSVSEGIIKELCKKLFDKFPEYNAICLGYVVRSYDSPHELYDIEVTQIGNSDTPSLKDEFNFMNDELNINYEYSWRILCDLEKLVDLRSYYDINKIYPGESMYVIIDSDLNIEAIKER